MDPTLIAVTLVSLALAIAMGLVTWRLLREERRRSSARVAALAELAGRPEAAIDPLDRPIERTPPVVAAPVETAVRVNPAVAATDLFGARETSDGDRRLLVFAVAVVLVVAFVGLLVTFGRTRPAGEAVSVRVAPLELLSLRHVKQGDTLTVSGLVLNPPEGRELRQVSAVVFVFDEAGEFIGSGRGALEFTRLAPGAESPFQITVANAGAVGRYRVGFRTDDGAVLGHVDRRTRPAAATAEAAREPAPASLAASLAGPR
jgi:hypothetical protein